MPQRPDFLTWREILDILESASDDVLDSPACVWLPHDVPLSDYDEFQCFSKLSPFDASLPASSENPLSLSCAFEPHERVSRLLGHDDITEVACGEFGWAEKSGSDYGYREEVFSYYFEHPDFPGCELRFDWLSSDFPVAMIEHKPGVVTSRTLYTEQYPTASEKQDALRELLSELESGVYDFLRT